MKRTYALASTLAFVAAASQAQAQNNYRGSDTLEVFTRTLAQLCGASGSYPNLTPFNANTGASGDFLYGGTGSGNGEIDIAAGCADFAPMSRALTTVARLCAGSVGVGREGEAAFSINGPGAAAVECYDHDSNPATPNICNNVPGSKAHGEIVALDGLSIVAGNDASNGVDSAYFCDSDGNASFGALLASTGKTVAGYSFNNGTADPADDWRDVLRVLWTGADNTRAAVAGGAANQVAGNRIDRCNSSVRRAIVADWQNILQTSCGTSCGPVRHLFRRDAASGTTDTFLTILGLNTTVNASQFCNGNDQEDLDPVRITCSTGGGLSLNNSNDPSLEDICNRDGTAGLVTPIAVPIEGNDPGTPGLLVTNADLYASQACALNSFQLRRNFRIGLSVNGTCPDGTPAALQQCWTPSTGGANQDCNCVNRSSSRSPSMGGVGDGRLYNRFVRRARAAGAGANQCPYVRPPGSTSDMVTAYYRLTTTPVGGASSCNKGSSTEQIGCLSDVLSCSAGYAGREAANEAGFQPSPGVGVAMALDGTNSGGVDAIGPSDQAIRALLDPSLAIAGSRYPFSRKLYFNTLIGFGNFRTQANDASLGGAVGPEHTDLIRCLRNEPALVTQATQTAGFVTLPAIAGLSVGGTLCEDMDEQNLCGQAANYNACDSSFGSGFPTL